MMLGPGDRRHGTWNGYCNHACRCDLCREAARLYRREHRQTERQREYDRRQRTAYALATKRLRDAHRAEFDRYYDELYATLLWDKTG